MPIAVGRLVALALGYLSPLHDPAHTRGNAIAPTNGPSDGFLEGFTPQPALDGRPPQVGLRRPQKAEHMKRDCLSNGTNFCFGDSSSYCSSCGTCCSSPSNGNNKWCCPSGGICCGNSCCGSGQTCNNGQCYLPVQTITQTTSLVITSTHIVSSLATVYQKVIDSSVFKSIVEVTNTNAQTQTNWVYVTTTSIGKRAEPAGRPVGDTVNGSGSTSPEGPNRVGATAGGVSEIASATSNKATTSTLLLPVENMDAAGPFTPPVPLLSAEPPAPTDAVAAEPILPREAQMEANTMAAAHSTSTIIHAVTITSIVTSIVASTTTIDTTSTGIQTVYQTNTVVLNAKTTVEATSTWTYTSHRPVTVTLTEIASVHNTQSASSSAATPALVTSPSGSVMPKKKISNGAIAGIAVGATIFAIVFCLAAFYLTRRHVARVKERKSITEDYAFLGTGRSDFDGPARSNSGSSKGPQMIMLNRHYSGPPPNARRPSVRSSVTSDAVPAQNERGLPPIPWYSAASKTSPPTSPISPTTGALPFSNDPMAPTSPTSPTYGRSVHMRSESAQTNGTARSSTIVGDNSNRNSVRSNSGKTVRFSNGGLPHHRASSSGSGTGTASENLDYAANTDEPYANVPTLQATPAPPAPALLSPIEQHAPAELHSILAPRADPPSPMLRPQLGRLRIVNGSADADDTSDQDEPMPRPNPQAM